MNFTTESRITMAKVIGEGIDGSYYRLEEYLKQQQVVTSGMEEFFNSQSFDVRFITDLEEFVDLEDVIESMEVWCDLLTRFKRGIGSLDKRNAIELGGFIDRLYKEGMALLMNLKMVRRFRKDTDFMREMNNYIGNTATVID